MARPRGTRSPDTRSRILAAAAAEFAAQGFAATSVDRIARAARVNKAMIYYHFKDKRALYAAILRDIYTAVGDRIRVAAAASRPPADRLDHVIEAFVRAFDEEQSLLPMFLRELAEGGAHLGPAELALIAGIFATIAGVIADGVRAKAFQPVHPALAHFTLIGPLFMFRATAPVRARIRRLAGTDIPDADSAAMTRHLQMVARRMLGRGAGRKR
jgi:TetR/AcrR family transcriptional regulator